MIQPFQGLLNIKGASSASFLLRALRPDVTLSEKWWNQYSVLGNIMLKLAEQPSEGLWLVYISWVDIKITSTFRHALNHNTARTAPGLRYQSDMQERDAVVKILMPLIVDTNKNVSNLPK